MTTGKPRSARPSDDPPKLAALVEALGCQFHQHHRRRNPMRKSAVPAVAAVAVAAALVASNAAMATHALIPSSQTSNTAAAVTLSGYANPDPDWSDDHWGTGDLDERTVPPVLGEEHAHGGPKHYDD
jgi:hypothetical protein